MLYRTLLAQTSVIVVLLMGSAFGQTDDPKVTLERPQKLKAMIDALANRSLKSPPKMFKPRLNEERPLFVAPYDAEEQRRVRTALLDLNKQMGNDLWRHLLAHVDDQRYAYTMQGDYYSKNLTVGDLCRQMALGDLVLAHRKHLPKKDDLSHASPERPQSLYPEMPSLDTLFPKGPVKWAEQHPKATLNDAQIMVTEWAIQNAPSLKGVSEQKRSRYVADLTKQIETLKETRQPLVETKRFAGESHACFSEKYAENLRKTYEAMLDEM